jgi:hypothetical protein
MNLSDCNQKGLRHVKRAIFQREELEVDENVPRVCSWGESAVVSVNRAQVLNASGKVFD